MVVPRDLHRSGEEIGVRAQLERVLQRIAADNRVLLHDREFVRR